MKTINELNSTANFEQEKKDGLKENNSAVETNNNNSSYNFGIIDLWRMQKKHKTLGSSIRWQPL